MDQKVLTYMHGYAYQMCSRKLRFFFWNNSELISLSSEYVLLLYRDLNVRYFVHMLIYFLTAVKLEMECGIPGLCLLRNRQALNKTRPVLLEVLFILSSSHLN
jgi:hypothetical protein